MAPTRRRGAPLVWLGVLIVAWTSGRAMLWESPFHQSAPATEGAALASVADKPVAPSANFQSPIESRDPTPLTDLPANIAMAGWPQSAGRPALVGQALQASTPRPFSPTNPTPVRLLDALKPPAAPAIPGSMLGPVAGAGTTSGLSGRANFPAVTPSVKVHLDAWFAWRHGSGASLAAGPVAARAYGGTQGGALLRYDLADSGRAPQAYLRGTHAPGVFEQSDLALGVSARPVAAVPVRLQAEARATRTAGSTFVRPALLAISEIPPVELPGGLRGEAYVQAGWIGGRFATGFIDGQVKADREIAQGGAAALRAGAGIWGGAQKSVGRLDIGPSLTLDLRRSAVPLRVSVDYRISVVGNVQPGDGIAVTVSTGF